MLRNGSIVAVHGIETQSPKTWTAYEHEKEPRGRATNWLCDEDMLPNVVPQARIWAYDYNSNCYSDGAPEIDILALGDTFLEMLRGAQDKGVGTRTLIFIGSCFGGILIAQVRQSNLLLTLGSYALGPSLILQTPDRR